MGEIPKELNEKIEEVKEIIEAVLSPEIEKKKKYERFRFLESKYRGKWDISK